MDRGRRAAATGPLPPIPSMRRPGAPATRPAVKALPERTATAERVFEDAEGWAHVRGGLRWIQIGLFLSLLYPLCHFGIALYSLYSNGTRPELVRDPPAGLLGKNINLFQELETGTWLVSGVFFFLFGLIGLLKCLRVPATARTRGVVFGTLLMTLLCLAGFAAQTFTETTKGAPKPTLRDVLVDLPQVPKEISVHVDRSIMLLAFLTLTWFVIFLAQASQPLGASKVLAEIALSAFLIIVVLIGIRVVNDYYPLNLTSPKITKEKEDEAVVIEAALYGIVWLLVAYSLMSVSGVVRRAVNLWMEDNKTTLGLAAE